MLTHNTYNMTSAIRITLTPELKMILEDLKRSFPALNDSELIKMAVSGFYSSNLQRNQSFNPTVKSSKIKDIFTNLKQHNQNSDLDEENFESWWTDFKKDIRKTK